MKILREGLISVGEKLGLKISSIENTIERKRLRVFERTQISVVLDVGANTGGYAAELRHSGFNGRIASFEPISSVFSQLQSRFQSDSHWTGHHMALGSADETSEINVSANTVSSSLLPMTEVSTSANAGTAYERKETIKVARLDTLSLELLKPTDNVYLKIDVQGFEKQVLTGAQKTLNQVKAIEMELSMTELYSGQSLMPEICAIVYELGYRLIWFERGFKDPKTGFLLQADGIFLREQ